jgi:hypothetical protein
MLAFCKIVAVVASPSSLKRASSMPGRFSSLVKRSNKECFCRTRAFLSFLFPHLATAIDPGIKKGTVGHPPSARPFSSWRVIEKTSRRPKPRKNALADALSILPRAG